MTWLRTAILLTLGATSLAAAAPAQSLLDRSPNVSGDWVPGSGQLQFNFVHRFTSSSAPERKVSNFPTFLVGAGLPGGVMVGFNYATNSTLAPRFPNEWEFFGRFAPLDEARGAPFHLAGQIGYNMSAEGLDGEIALAKRLGPARLIAVNRFLADPYVAGDVDIAVGGGAAVQLNRYVALAGDVASLVERDSARGERVAWSAGIHVAIPRTPHTLSIQATNTNTATLQGLSRGDDQLRFGFEFTVPLTLARFFATRRAERTPRPPAGAPLTPSEAPGHVPDGPTPDATTISVDIRGIAYQRTEIEITAGTTVRWTNGDPVAHTVTAEDGTFDSGEIGGGETWSYTFTKPGTYPVFCVPHPFMTATIVVREAP